MVILHAWRHFKNQCRCLRLQTDLYDATFTVFLWSSQKLKCNQFYVSCLERDDATKFDPVIFDELEGWMTMTMTHSEESHIGQMRAWPYRQECRGWSHKKESVLHVELALWQGVHIQTVKDRVQCTESWDELKVQKKQQRHEPQAVAVLNSQ